MQRLNDKIELDADAAKARAMGIQMDPIPPELKTVLAEVDRELVKPDVDMLQVTLDWPTNAER